MNDSNQNSSHQVLMQMRREVAADGVLLADQLRPQSDLPAGAGYSDLFTAAASETTAADHYRVGLEYIFEGYLLHFGVSRLLGSDTGEGFRLLAGDYMYACGLSRIAQLDDPVPIRALADLIGVCARVRCAGLDPALALGAWSATTLCLAAHAAGDPTAAASIQLLQDSRKAAGQQAEGGGASRTALMAAPPENIPDELQAIIDTIYASFNPAISA
ncbi:MAG: hypothetical protein ACYCXF_00770 [Thermoleophilia bacterium]